MCGIVGGMDTDRGMLKGSDFIEAIRLQHDRGNGQGGGFAAYGIYPELSEYYALHIACDNESAAQKSDDFIRAHLYIKIAEDMPTKDVKGIDWHPLLKRYFCFPGPSNEDLKLSNLSRTFVGEGWEGLDAYMKRFVFDFNRFVDGAYILSCGKNMGVFKGVGYPEEIGEFFLLDRMEASVWIAHSRFPTNTQSWWGGAHPFSLLEWSVVHNGEITSYGVNRNYLEMFGYDCLLRTDTEVISYLFDLFIRERGMSLQDACTILSPPLWEDIERMENKEEKRRVATLRRYYPEALLNGPFAILVSNGTELIAMNDNLKLRPLVAAQDGDRFYFSSEECSFEVLCPARERTWMLEGGKPEIVRIKGVPDAA
ncbi:MAG: glutamine amidotransferase family protein [Spirochaetes bacterium]|nr:glutamine amidotransferase family protein [Spirochaetota bacterium]